MPLYTVTFPTGQTITLPPATVTAIAQASAKYPTPLWHYRAERVLKLGAHQWIYPADRATLHAVFALHPMGILCTAWKLFNRGWLAAAEAYWLDPITYPNHPRHFGRHVIPLVDEDSDVLPSGAAQIGWARIEQTTVADQQYAVFVQFTLLDLFAPQALPVEYGQ